MGKSSSKAEQPDLVGAAREEGEQARLLAQEETLANRPDQFNPWGSVTWDQTKVWNPESGRYDTQWAQRETLNPQLQAQLDAQMGLGANRAEVANTLFQDFASGYQPLDFSEFGDPQQLGDVAGLPQFDPNAVDPTGLQQKAADDFYAMQTARLDPQFERERASMEQRLMQQGLSPQDAAYQAQMEQFGQRQNDAYTQARLGATGQSMALGNQMFNQALGGYQAQLAGQQQGFGQQMQQNQLANALRSQQIDEQLKQTQANLGVMDWVNQGITPITGGSPSGSVNFGG